jgi:DNA polymerase-4
MDADAFFASVHLLEDPSLRGKPLVVAGSGARSIVTTASYEARAYGIGSAMPAAKARRLCPHATFISPNRALYVAYSRRAMDIVRRFVDPDSIEVVSIDEAYLDLTTLDQPIATMRDVVAAIQHETGLTYSVGMGPNKLCAKVLSDYRKPQAFNVASREQCCDIFADSPPRLIPGVGPKTAATLDSLGLDSISALRDAPNEVLVRAVGERRALDLRELCSFHHAGRVQAHRELKSRSEESTFETDVTDIAELEWRMRRMSVDLCHSLAKRELRGRTIGIKVRLADFTTVTRARTIDVRTNDSDVVADIACELLREYAPSQAVRLLGVRLAGFVDAGIETAQYQQLELPVAVASAARD